MFQEKGRGKASIECPVSISAVHKNLFVGNINTVTNPTTVLQLGIQAIVSLNGAVGPLDAERLGVKSIRSFNLIDGEGNDARTIRLAIHSVLDFIRIHGKTLVQCQAGHSRSVMVSAGAIAVLESMDVETALKNVEAIRQSTINPQLRTLLLFMKLKKDKPNPLSVRRLPLQPGQD